MFNENVLVGAVSAASGCVFVLDVDSTREFLILPIPGNQGRRATGAREWHGSGKNCKGQAMTVSGWLQFGLFVALLVAITKPLGIYLYRVLDPLRVGKRTFLDPVLRPIERLIYSVCCA